MILEFPTKDDFYNAANGFLNSSWDSVTEHLHEFEQVHGIVEDSDHPEDIKLYWTSAKQTLTNATALVQQAVEFFIKGRIVEVSPYLLISGSPQSWPRGCNKKNIEFSAFRTLDAQDLIKVHDTVCAERFTHEFIQWNEALRTIRNKVMHTVDRSLNILPEELVNFILYTHNYFNSNSNWFYTRRKYLENTPVNSMKSIQLDNNHESYIVNSLLIDFRLAVDILPPAVCKKYFGYDKKNRNLHCPSCINTVSRMDLWDYELIDDLGKTYQRTSKSGVYLCPLCGYKGEIIEKDCQEWGCNGQFQDSKSGVCLSCFIENSL